MAHFTFDAFASVPMDPQSSSVTMVRSQPSNVDRSMAPRRNDGARLERASQMRGLPQKQQHRINER